MRRLSRSAVTAAAAVVAISALGACTAGGSSGGSGDHAKGNVTLTFLTFETPNLTAATWDAAIARASALVPGVTIKKLVAPTVDRTAYAKQLATSGQLPDIMIAVTVGDFVKAGYLAPFDQSQLTNFVSPTANQINGKTYQLPWGSQAIPFVYYNKADFAKAGIAAPPTTYADFLADCAKLKAVGITPIEIGGGGSDTFANSYPLVASVGTDVYKSDPNFLAEVKAGTKSFTDPQFVAAAQKVVDLAKAGYLDKGGLSRSYANTEQAFRDGKAAMYPMGSWFPASVDAKPTSFGLGSFPWPSDSGSPVLSVYTGGGISVSSKAADVALAKKWAIAFTTNTANLDSEAKADGVFMAIKGYKAPSTLGPAYQASNALYSAAVSAHAVVPAFAQETGSDAMPSGMLPDLYSGIADLINGRKTAHQFAQFLNQSYKKNTS